MPLPPSPLNAFAVIVPVPVGASEPPVPTVSAPVLEPDVTFENEIVVAAGRIFVHVGTPVPFDVRNWLIPGVAATIGFVPSP